jgi:hypothetical protein
MDAFLASSRPSKFETRPTTENQVNHMANHLLFMSISAFKPSSTTCTSIEIKNDKNSYVYRLMKYSRVVLIDIQKN